MFPHLEHVEPRHAHAVVRLNPLHAEVNGSACPVRVGVIYRDKNDILGENVNLNVRMSGHRKMQHCNAQRTFFVHFASRPPS